MRKNIHPEWHKQAKILLNGKVVLEVGSTVPEMNVEIWSGNHPFYTGNEITIDADNRIETFNKKRESAAKLKKISNIKIKKEPNQQKEKKPLTLKDMLESLNKKS